MFKVQITMHDTTTGAPVKADGTGLLVIVLAVLLFFPFLLTFGFTLPTWTVVTIIGAALVHFLVFFYGASYKCIKEEVRREREQRKLESK